MSWRATIRTNTHQQLVDYLAANPTQLSAVYPVRPKSFPEVPCAYVGEQRHALRHDAGTRQILAEVDIIVLHSAIDNEASKDDVDAIADGLVDWFTARPHYVFANTVSEPTAVEDVAVDVGAITYTGVTVTIGRIIILEGR